jgi:hypothetical protein
MHLPKRAATLNICLIILLTTPIFLNTVKADVKDISLISNSSYLDLSKNLQVVGEVKNVGDKPYQFIKISINYYDKNGQLIASRFDLTMLNLIMPGRKSPFDISLLDNLLSAQVDHYSISISLLDTSTVVSLPLNLEVTFNKFISNSQEPLSVTLKNKGSQVAENVKVVATYYDNSGHVIAATVNYIDDEDATLGAGEYSTRSLPLDSIITPYVVSYRITAESTQFGITSEISGNVKSPLISNISPADGSENIKSTTKALNFSISEPTGAKMSYYISLEPDGFKVEKTNVEDGVYSVAIPSLRYETDYVWTLSVKGGNVWTNNTYTFRTEALKSPIISNVSPADGAEDIKSTIKSLNFTISEPNGANMIYIVSMEPGGFKIEKDNISNGSYNIAISSLTPETDYVWTLSVKGSNAWTNNTYTFRTGVKPQSGILDLYFNYIILIGVAAIAILIVTYLARSRNVAS